MWQSAPMRGSAPVWDPAKYLRFGAERARPFADLVARVHADQPRVVVDLGCGPGTLTATLAERWPAATLYGLDSSPEMVAAATSAGGPVKVALGDVREWRPGPDVDVVVSNAALQWVSGHLDLLPRWAAALRPGSWLAFQVPGNHEAPSHQAMRAVAAEPRWGGRLADAAAAREVPDATGYAAVLTRAGCAVDAWETTYVHLLPADPAHPVLRWMEGTALRPVHAVLGDGSDWDAFRDTLRRRLADAYPVTDGMVYFPFRRIFVVARTGARP